MRPVRAAMAVARVQPSRPGAWGRSLKEMWSKPASSARVAAVRASSKDEPATPVPKVRGESGHGAFLSVANGNFRANCLRSGGSTLRPAGECCDGEECDLNSAFGRVMATGTNTEACSHRNYGLRRLLDRDCRALAIVSGSQQRVGTSTPLMPGLVANPRPVGSETRPYGEMAGRGRYSPAWSACFGFRFAAEAHRKVGAAAWAEDRRRGAGGRATGTSRPRS